MAYTRVKETTFGNPIKSIVKFPDHYVATTAIIKKTKAVQDAEGRYYIPAGTCLKDGLTNGNTTTGASPCAKDSGDNSIDKFDSVVMNDEYFATGEDTVNVTILIHGFVRKKALVKVKETVPESNNAMIIAL